MKAGTRALLLLAAVALAFGAVRQGGQAEAPRGSFLERSLRPAARVAAALAWARFDRAWAAGDEARAWTHASRALELAPGDAAGWVYLAHHAVYERASPRRGLPPPERRAWVEVGLELLERGEREARDGGPCAFKLGIVWASLALEEDGARALPVGRGEAWARAAEAFGRAASHGQALAGEAARLARAESEAAGG